MVLVRAMHMVSLVKRADRAPHEIETSHSSRVGVRFWFLTKTELTNLR